MSRYGLDAPAELQRRTTPEVHRRRRLRNDSGQIGPATCVLALPKCLMPRPGVHALGLEIVTSAGPSSASGMDGYDPRIR